LESVQTFTYNNKSYDEQIEDVLHLFTFPANYPLIVGKVDFTKEVALHFELSLVLPSSPTFRLGHPGTSRAK
jgi:hypothetical protein